MWGLTALTIVTIFATLGLARSLANWLNQQGWADATFGLGMVLVCGAIVLVGLKVRPRMLEIGIALGIIAVYLIVFARMTIPAERTHLIEYSVLALLMNEALVERKANGRRVPMPALAAFLASSTIGVLDEAVQFLIPGRYFDGRDIVFNVLASLMAVGGILILTHTRNWLKNYRESASSAK